MFYRSEIFSGFDQLSDFSVIGAESWLDSKKNFALIWDKNNPLNLGMQSLEYFRKYFPYSILVEELKKEKQFKNFVEAWLLKATDVEEDYSWGLRGIILGSRVTKKNFKDYFFGLIQNGRKNLGNNPIIQEFCESIDFTEVWNDIIDDKYYSSGLDFGLPNLKKDYAEKKVYARIGVYILINTKNKVFIPNYGILTLRQDPVAHGTSDSLFFAFKLV